MLTRTMYKTTQTKNVERKPKNNEEEVIEAENEMSDDESYSDESRKLDPTQNNCVDEILVKMGRKMTSVVNLLHTKNDDNIIRILNQQS